MVRHVQFRNVAPLSPDEIRQEMQGAHIILLERPYDPGAVEQTKVLLKKLYNARGVKVAVESTTEADMPRSIAVVFTIRPLVRNKAF